MNLKPDWSRPRAGAPSVRLACFLYDLIGLFAVLNILRPEFYREVAKDPLFAPMMTGPPILLIMGVAMIWRMVNFKI